MIRGEEALKKVYEGGEYRDYRYMVLIAPISRTYLLYGDILEEIRLSRELLVIPSSYDDVAIYVNMRREGYRICSRKVAYGDINIICLERGEKPWGWVSVDQGGSYRLIFSEDLDPIDIETLYRDLEILGYNSIYISYGIAQPPGIMIRRRISIRLNPFRDSIIKMITNRALYIEMEFLVNSTIYRASLTY
jgi:hypothetical protein